MEFFDIGINDQVQKIQVTGDHFQSGSTQTAVIGPKNLVSVSVCSTLNCYVLTNNTKLLQVLRLASLFVRSVMANGSSNGFQAPLISVGIEISWDSDGWYTSLPNIEACIASVCLNFRWCWVSCW